MGLKFNRISTASASNGSSAAVNVPSKRSCSKQGFTLIELLVVIAIISLLVSILLPSLAKAKELAKSVVCQSNLKGCSLAMLLYENDMEIVPWTEQNCPWQLKLRDSGYLEEADCTRCPSAEPIEYNGYYFTYGMPYGPNMHGGVWASWKMDDLCSGPFGTADFSPYEVPMLMDSFRPIDGQQLHCVMCACFPQYVYYVDCRHVGMANVVWLDGHVGSVEPSEPWEWEWHPHQAYGEDGPP